MKMKDRKSVEKTNIKSSKVIQAKISNPAKMLRMFTKDLYKHPLQTSIQEYINNAKDAHLMVNKSMETIEITAPTVSNQSITIKDFGPGLSPDDIVNIFANITVSNKDESDKFNGGFGIGSKSWFAVSNSFMVVSRFKKVKTYYSVNFSDKDGITISVDHEEKTSEKNGVEVILPLADKKQIKESNSAIIRAVNYWKVKPKLINIEDKFKNIIYREKDYSLISRKSDEGDISVTLGETKYSIKELPCYSELINDKFEYINVVLHFDVGEMGLKNIQEVGPDRESFSLACNDAINKKALLVFDKIISKMKNDLKKMDNAKDITEFLNNPLSSFVIPHRTVYEHELKCGQKIKFSNNLPSIVGKKAQYQKLSGRVCQLVDHVNRISSMKDILILDKDLKEKEINAVIDTFADNETQCNSRWRNTFYSNGVYVATNDEFDKKTLKELGNYFNIRYASKIEFKLPERLINKKTSKGLINCMDRTDHFNSNTKLSLAGLKKYFIISNTDYLKCKDISWKDINYISKKTNKDFVLVSSSNFERLSLQKFKIKKCEDFILELKNLKLKETEDIINEIKDKGIDKYWAARSTLDYIRDSVDDIYYKEDVYSIINYLARLMPKNKIVKEMSSINWELASDIHRYHHQLNKMKIKKNNEYVKFLKRLKKERPMFYANLYFNKKTAYKKEMLLLLKGFK